MQTYKCKETFVSSSYHIDLCIKEQGGDEECNGNMLPIRLNTGLVQL